MSPNEYLHETFPSGYSSKNRRLYTTTGRTETSPSLGQEDPKEAMKAFATSIDFGLKSPPSFHRITMQKIGGIAFTL
jgi:hypothetical protein